MAGRIVRAPPHEALSQRITSVRAQVVEPAVKQHAHRGPLVEPGPQVDAGVDRANHAKYDRYGANIVGTVVSAEAARSTLRLVPR
jgi:hypothetical protein